MMNLSLESINNACKQHVLKDRVRKWLEILSPEYSLASQLPKPPRNLLTSSQVIKVNGIIADGVVKK